MNKSLAFLDFHEGIGGLETQFLHNSFVLLRAETATLLQISIKVQVDKKLLGDANFDFKKLLPLNQ